MANGKAKILGGFDAATGSGGSREVVPTIIPYNPAVLQAWAAS
jgi:hypothetical protein